MFFRVSTRTTRIRSLVALPVAALVLAACNGLPGGGDPATAARVNGEVIPVEELERRFETVSNSPQLAEQLEADEDGTLTEQIQAQILTQLIQTEILEQGAEDLGIELTDEDLEEQREELVEQIGGEEAFDQIVEENQLTEEDVESELRTVALSAAIEEALTEDIEIDDDDIEAAYDEQRDERFGETAEARHILTEEEDEADEARERIDDGEDFADVAEDLSIDEGSAAEGGDLGEFSRGQMIEEFGDAVFEAEVGDVVGPIETSFGWHVIEVQDLSEGPELEDVADDLRDELVLEQGQGVVEEWLNERNAEAEVEVNPQFGEWDPETGQVIPESMEDGEQPMQPQPEGQAPPQEGEGPEQDADIEIEIDEDGEIVPQD